MANKTINELTELTSFVENDELAIYDVSNDLTTKGSIKNLFKTSLTDLNTTSKNLIGAINEVATSGGGGGEALTPAVKTALLALASKVAYIDQGGASYYQALYNALYPPIEIESILVVYTQSGTVYDADSLDSLKADLVVTAVKSDSTTETVPSTEYVLSGMLEVGISTINVSYGGKTASFNVTVTETPRSWDTGIPLTLGTVESGGISQTTGADNESTSYSRTAGFVDIEGAHIILSRDASSKDSTGNNTAFYFYDADHDFISSKGFNSSNNKVTMTVVPQDTKYVRFTAPNENIGESASTPYEFIPYATPVVPYTEGDVSITSSTVTAGAIQRNGTQNSASTKTSQLIPIYGAQSITAIASDGSALSKTFALYDKDENFMMLVSSYGTGAILASDAIPYNQCAYMKLTSIWNNTLPITVTFE